MVSFLYLLSDVNIEMMYLLYKREKSTLDKETVGLIYGPVCCIFMHLHSTSVIFAHFPSLAMWPPG